MRVSSDLYTLPVIMPGWSSSPVQAIATTEHDSAEFTQIAKLSAKLQALPGARTEQVQQGKTLAEGPSYPPPYTILCLARLLAMDLTIGDSHE
jgi:hypothetical protein